jgi:glycosyltransferase involved in cell wall biosynthesis
MVSVGPRPRVSVVIAFLNAERYLAEAIQSVVAQTYEDWELFLVDDGSTDGSAAVAEDYAGRDARITCLHHPDRRNFGASASRNLGMRNARGEYLAYLDADDAWLPTKLEEQVRLLDDSPDVGMVYGPALEWYSWTGRPRDRARDSLRNNAVPPSTVLRPPQMLSLFLRNQRAVPSPSGILVRTAAIRNVGGSEESFRSIYDDQVLYAKVGLTTSALVTDRCWYKYRVHEAQRVSLSVRAGDGLRIREEFLRWLEGYLERGGYAGTEIWAAVQRELRPFNDPFLNKVERARHLAGRIKMGLKRRMTELLPIGPSPAPVAEPRAGAVEERPGRKVKR